MNECMMVQCYFLPVSSYLFSKIAHLKYLSPATLLSNYNNNSQCLSLVALVNNKVLISTTDSEQKSRQNSEPQNQRFIFINSVTHSQQQTKYMPKNWMVSEVSGVGVGVVGLPACETGKASVFPGNRGETTTPTHPTLSFHLIFSEQLLSTTSFR